jgi:hypothetical protein
MENKNMNRKMSKERRSFGQSAMAVLSALFGGVALALLFYGTMFDLNMFYSSGPLFGLSYLCNRMSD